MRTNGERKRLYIKCAHSSTLALNVIKTLELVVFLLFTILSNWEEKITQGNNTKGGKIVSKMKKIVVLALRLQFLILTSKNKGERPMKKKIVNTFQTFLKRFRLGPFLIVIFPFTLSLLHWTCI